MTDNSFQARSEFQAGGKTYEIYRLDAVETAANLPFSLKILLENLLRNEDDRHVTANHIQAMANWNPTDVAAAEIPYTPARVLMQDFTGVPCVVDLVGMRDAMVKLGGDPRKINPLIPTELVIDHSVIADVFNQPDAYLVNAQREFERNEERYQLLRWAGQAFDDFLVVPPNTGICHQVNLEYLSRVVFTHERDGKLQAYPDTLVGTDSHTPMVNGLGVLGWGVGGIEAEAAMLGQPMSMLIPEVIGVKLTGELREGTTATDLVLTVTELLRKTRVVGKFVEFFGPGVAHVPLANRATLGNMSPEYGSTCAIFPIDEETLRYMRLTGRSEEQIGLVKAYAKEKELWHDPDRPADYSQVVELNLSDVMPSIAGPKRPQDRIPLSIVPGTVGALLSGESQEQALKAGGVDQGSWASFPASDPITFHTGDRIDEPPRDYEAQEHDGAGATWPSDPAQITLDGEDVDLDHGDVVIAAITSCTNTSNPEVMIGAGLLAKKAVERGLRRKPWVKTTLAPGSRVVTDYFERAGLTPYLEKLGFSLVGYGCTTCIGNSGPLIPEVSEGLEQRDLTVCAVLSGNRNFEGRIHGEVKMNFLASPPLVIAYAVAGTMRTNVLQESLGQDENGEPVYLRDIWPSSDEVQAVIEETLEAKMFSEGYSDVFTGDENWRDMQIPAGDMFEWADDSTYVRQPPFFDGMQREPAPISDITGARVLAKLGDSVTTDHISPAGAIAGNSPAGRYLRDHGVQRRDFNSYGSRRGNHEVMMRGTFANVRLRNELAPGTEGGVTRHLPSGEQMSIYDAAMSYIDEDVPLLVIAGAEYGSGSSRDWAAKGTLLLGVRAVLAASYERIHRSNLIGMGVLPRSGTEGGVTRHLPSGEQMSIYDAAMSYIDEDVPLLVIAGAEYGSGSSRDWAAKGTLLLGVRAVLAASYERIHRSNLIGMGVLPLQFHEGDSAESLGLTGEEIYSITGLEGQAHIPREVTVMVEDSSESGNASREFTATVRIDTPAEESYFIHGGILPYVLRNLLEG